MHAIRSSVSKNQLKLTKNERNAPHNVPLHNGLLTEAVKDYSGLFYCNCHRLKKPFITFIKNMTAIVDLFYGARQTMSLTTRLDI